MNLRNLPKLLLVFVFVAAALAAGSDADKAITVKATFWIQRAHSPKA